MKLVKKQKDGSQSLLNTTEKSKHTTDTSSDLPPWKVIIIDDDPDVHTVTQLSLKNFEFRGRTLQTFIANSGYEAFNLLKKHSDVAVALIDIMMETDDAGLHLINNIRNVLQYNLMRIIVRTGQPGIFSEKDVIEQYDIDDYKNKAELNADRLYLTMRLALKNYQDLLALNDAKYNLEQKIRERTLQLEQKNQRLQSLNQEKNEFLGIAAHDLKNPLQAIQGSAELIAISLQEGCANLEELIDYANMINVSSERMFDLITNLLDVNAIEEGKFELNLQYIDILPRLNHIVEEYKEKAQIKRVSVYFEPQQAEYIAYTDVNVLHQVIDNLISNAVKYSPFDKHIFIRIFNQKQNIRIEVQDQGQGLSQEEQTKLFTKFTRLSTKPTNGEHSTGLGLFIVKKLITALNGEVWCESELKQGATFILTLPAKMPVVSN